jgi:hypothetical protein
MAVPFLKVNPKAIRLKVLPQFPANLEGRTGIDIERVNGNYFVDLDYSDFAPAVVTLSDPANQNALLWNDITGAYSLVPISLFGGIPEAPNDGQQYARQSLGWSVVVSGSVILPSDAAPIMDGVAAPGVLTTYSRGDHVHPTDTSRAPTVHTHTASQITDFAEATDDRVAALLVAGPNITLTYNDPANTLTIAASGGGGGASVTISDTPPGSPTAGNLWWESDTGNLYIYYNDGTSSQWVIVVGGSATAPGHILGEPGNGSAVTGEVGEFISGSSLGSGNVTITIATPAVFTQAAHGISAYSAIQFTTTGALPTGLAVGTTYYTLGGAALTANTFQVATSMANAIAGVAVATSGSQSGTHSIALPSLATGAAKDIIALVLPAGDWEVSGSTQFVAAGSTSVTFIGEWLSTVSATFTSKLLDNGYVSFNGPALTGYNSAIPTSPVRFSFAVPTTVYLTVLSNFTVSTMQAYSMIRARRAR